MISNIENYLSKCNNLIDYNLINYNYKNFNYDDKELFKLHLDFLLNNFYKHIKINNLQIKRLNQEEFRKLLLNKYKKCIITNNDCVDELEACHIIEHKDGGSCDINNGLLLERNIHSTFDKNLWCIKPDKNNCVIEIKNGHNGTITKYKDVKIYLPELYNNLLLRYNNFLKS
jgi:predicted restriction endonuclease